MKHSLPNEVQAMTESLATCLEDWTTFIPKPHHSGLVEEWKNEMKNFMSASLGTDDDEEDELVESITTGLLEAYECWTTASETTHSTAFSKPVDHEQTFKLMQRPQTAQRTTDWYKEFQSRLTASEIFKLFGPPRERAILVMQKAGKLEMGARSNTLVVLKERLGPLDWGICFEPVIKLILEKEWGAMIHECGRFVHPADPRLAASPDGLLLKVKAKPQMAGHLLEIKCPKSRKIGLKIPMEYYYQMQLQMEVTGVRACEYVEARFELCDTGQAQEKGWCGLIGVIGEFSQDFGGWKPSRYVYGPLGDLLWKPDLGLNEQTLEINTWICPAFHHEMVLRDEAWFASTLQPKINEFWSDIEKAKAGEFAVPESSRKKKEQKCEIVDSDTETPKLENSTA
jgi:hypothetical protein